MGNPYAQGVLAEAKIYSSVHVDYSTPEDAAAIALSVKTNTNTRHDYALKVFQDKGKDITNKTAQKLLNIMERRFKTHEQLSSLGYTNVRHLQGEGLTIAEIARDLDMNQLDLMAYMTAHPNALQDATVDAAACADAKIRDFLTQLENEPPRTKFEASRKEIQYKVLLEQVKRISAEWAQFAKRPVEEEAKGGFQLNITLNQSELIRSGEMPESKIIEAEVVDIPLDAEGEYVDPLGTPRPPRLTQDYDFD